MLFSDDRGEEMDSSKMLEHLEIDILWSWDKWTYTSSRINGIYLFTQLYTLLYQWLYIMTGCAESTTSHYWNYDAH